MPEPLVTLDGMEKFISPHVGHTDIRNNQIGQISGLHLLEYRLRTVEIATVVVPPQSGHDDFADHVLVIDNEYLLLVHIFNTLIRLKNTNFVQIVTFLSQSK